MDSTAEAGAKPSLRTHRSKRQTALDQLALAPGQAERSGEPQPHSFDGRVTLPCLRRRLEWHGGKRREDRPTTVNALVYAFYGLVALVVIVAVLWLFGVVPGWVVPAVLAVTVIVFVLLWRTLDRFRRTLSEWLSFGGPPPP